MTSLWSSISEVSGLLHKGLLNAVHLTELSIEHQKAISKLNVFITPTQDYALKKAELSQARLEQRKSKGCLEGIPIVVKDNFCTKGIRTSCGSKMLSNYVPPYSATVVQRLEDAGAVIIGKSNLDEFAMGDGNIHSAFGPTKNIYKSGINYTLGDTEIRDDENNSSKIDHDWIVAGGSSGGSAVAVTSGAAFVGLGSDTGGSVRNPASYCGIVGYKPSYGIIPRHGLVSLVNSLDVPGIFGRTVDDVSQVFKTIAGVDENDSTSQSLNQSYSTITPLTSLKGTVIGIPKEYHCEGINQEILQAWNNTAQVLKDAGAEVREISMPHTHYSYTCYFVLNPCEIASNFTRYNGLEYGNQILDSKSMEATFALSRAAGLNETVRGRILAGNYFLLKNNIDAYFKKALKIRHLIQQDFINAWQDGIHFLLTPTTAKIAPRYSELCKEDDHTETSMQDFCTQANMAGVCALNLPITHSTSNLPISLQLMAPQGEDLSLFSIGIWLERQIKYKVLKLMV